MINRKKIPFLIAILVGVVFAFSGCRHPGAHHRAEFMVDYISESLDLTDRQKEHVDQIKEELIAKAMQMREKKKAMHDEFVAELKKEEMDQQHLKDLISEHRAQMDEMINLILARLVEFHRTLTPEQKTKLVSKLEQFHKWHAPKWE
jgi:Spy/CpxP family protein refolding chaperone